MGKADQRLNVEVDERERESAMDSEFLALCAQNALELKWQKPCFRCGRKRALRMSCSHCDLPGVDDEAIKAYWRARRNDVGTRAR